MKVQNNLLINKIYPSTNSWINFMVVKIEDSLLMEYYHSMGSNVRSWRSMNYLDKSECDLPMIDKNLLIKLLR